MRIIAFTNQKGGVGKTTSVVNIGAGLARSGKKVLLIDLDPQANLTASLGFDVEALEETIYDLLLGKASVDSITLPKNDFFILPSSLDLSGAEIALASVVGRETILKRSLAKTKGYDYILIDCPPSLGLLTLNAFTTAQEIIIPVQTEFLSLRGMRKLLETIEVVRERLNDNLSITGIIATLYDGRKSLHKEAIGKLQEHFGEKMFKTFVRDTVALAESQSFGEPIFNYKSNSYAAEDYTALCTEILTRTNS